MKKVSLLLVINILFGLELINVNFFPKKNELDVLFSLNGKFNSKIVEIKRNEYILKGVRSEKEFQKIFDNYFIKLIKIKPINNGVLVYFEPKNNYSINVALGSNGYGIRFRIVSLKENFVSSPKKNDEMSYLVYVLFLILILLGILFYLKIKRKKRVKKVFRSEDIKLLAKKPIDAKNNLVLVEFNNRKYLLVVGNSNILLDIFDKNMVNISTEIDFDNILKSEIDSKFDDSLREYIENAEKLKEFNERI